MWLGIFCQHPRDRASLVAGRVLAILVLSTTGLSRFMTQALSQPLRLDPWTSQFSSFHPLRSSPRVSYQPVKPCWPRTMGARGLSQGQLSQWGPLRAWGESDGQKRGGRMATVAWSDRETVRTLCPSHRPHGLSDRPRNPDIRNQDQDDRGEYSTES